MVGDSAKQSVDPGCGEITPVSETLGLVGLMMEDHGSGPFRVSQGSPEAPADSAVSQYVCGGSGWFLLAWCMALALDCLAVSVWG